MGIRSRSLQDISLCAVRRAVLLARLLMPAIAPITRCRLPAHSFLSSFRLACVVHLFLIASSGLYQLVGVGSGFKAFRSFDLTSFKVTFVCETSWCLWPLPFSWTRSVSDAKPAMNWSLMTRLLQDILGDFYSGFRFPITVAVVWRWQCWNRNPGQIASTRSYQIEAHCR